MSLVLIVLVLFPVQVVKVDGKVVSFLVKNCGIETPIIVPTFPSITEAVDPKLFIEVVLFDLLIPNELLFNEFIVETIFKVVVPKRFIRLS